jgi:hypothetical protein
MHVKAPFAYSVDYFKNEGRKLVQRTLVDYVEGEVPEIPLSESPVAIRWRQRSRFSDRGFPVEVRTYQGRFYAKGGYDIFNRVPADVDASIFSHPDVEAGATQLFSGESFGRFMNAVQEHLKGKNQKRPSPKDIETDLGDDFVERRDDAENRLARLVTIDGKVWSEVDEPTLAIRADEGIQYDSQIQKFILLKEPRLASFGAPPEASAYRIGQNDRWHHYRQPSGKETIRELALDIVVEIPGIYTFDAPRNAMLRAVESFVSLIGPEIHGWDQSSIDGYLSIRNRLEAYMADRRTAEIEDIFEDARTIIEGIRGRTIAYRTVRQAFVHAGKEEPDISISFT